MTLRLPEELWQGVETVRRDVPRETWVREAVRQRVERDKGLRAQLRELMRPNPGQVPGTHMLAGAERPC